jgi:hypothetical protein
VKGEDEFARGRASPRQQLCAHGIVQQAQVPQLVLQSQGDARNPPHKQKPPAGETGRGLDLWCWPGRHGRHGSNELAHVEGLFECSRSSAGAQQRYLEAVEPHTLAMPKAVTIPVPGEVLLCRKHASKPGGREAGACAATATCLSCRHRRCWLGIAAGSRRCSGRAAQCACRQGLAPDDTCRL